MKPKCSICKNRSIDNRHYRGRLLCPECHYEYKAIFEGWQSNKSKKAFNMKKAWDMKYYQGKGCWDGFFNGESHGATDDGVGSQ